VKDFKDLKVWRKAHELTLAIYRATRTVPRDEMYGLVSQLRRAASSIGANIAEGCGRRSDREFVRFLQIARASASEVEYHLLLAHDLEYMRQTEFAALQHHTVELQRMLTSLVQAVRGDESTDAEKKSTSGAEVLHSAEVEQNSSAGQVYKLAARS
jgi:four helix bundle protein